MYIQNWEPKPRWPKPKAEEETECNFITRDFSVCGPQHKSAESQSGRGIILIAGFFVPFQISCGRTRKWKSKCKGDGSFAVPGKRKSLQPWPPGCTSLLAKPPWDASWAVCPSDPRLTQRAHRAKEEAGPHKTKCHECHVHVPRSQTAAAEFWVCLLLATKLGKNKWTLLCLTFSSLKWG